MLPPRCACPRLGYGFALAGFRDRTFSCLRVPGPAMDMVTLLPCLTMFVRASTTSPWRRFAATIAFTCTGVGAGEPGQTPTQEVGDRQGLIPTQARQWCRSTKMSG